MLVARNLTMVAIAIADVRFCGFQLTGGMMGAIVVRSLACPPASALESTHELQLSGATAASRSEGGREYRREGGSTGGSNGGSEEVQGG